MSDNNIDQEKADLARRQESEMFLQAQVENLLTRATALNYEIRLRDEEIARLTKELAFARGEASEPEVVQGTVDEA